MRFGSGRSMKRAFPRLPRSFANRDLELQDYPHGNFHQAPYSDAAGTPPVANSASSITPYLGLPARLSQVWINRWTVLLLLVLARMLLAVRSMDNGLDSARREALSACTGVESMGSAMASMPHYMSQGVNELTATGVEKAVNGLMSMLTLTITAVEELVVFVVNLLTSTYVCLITLAVRGSMHVAIELVKDVGDFLNKTMADIGRDIHKDIKGFQDDLNKFASVLNNVPKIFGSSSTIPTINIDGSLNKLNNLQIPMKFDQELDKLNASIPTFAQVNNFTNNILRMPFEKVKKQVNETMVAYKFDRSVFPVPPKERLTFCSEDDAINSFFNKLVALVHTTRKTFMIVLIVLAILACGPMAYREVWRWRTTQKRAQLVRRGAFDPIDVLQIAARPYTSTVGIKVAARFGSPRRQILVRWLVAYATSTPALFLLSLGFAGLFACACHYALLRRVEHETPALARHVGQFAGRVVTALNGASAQWARGANGALDAASRELNAELFGWANMTTGAVNETLNVFVDEMARALNKTFGGTVLHEPVKEVLHCLIGLKIAGVQRGLRWVADNARVDLPRLRNDTFSLGAAVRVTADDDRAAAGSFLADPGSRASDKITNVVAQMTARVASSIRTEALIATVLLLLWLAVAAMGLARVLFLFWCSRDKLRGEGGDELDTAPPPSRSAPHAGTTTTAAAANTRHSSFLFPHAFRTSPNSASPNDEQFHYSGRPGTNNKGHVDGSNAAAAGARRRDEEEEEEKLGYAGMRKPAVAVTAAHPYETSASSSPSSSPPQSRDGYRHYAHRSSHGVLDEKR